MSRSAKVTSIDAVKTFAAALRCFQDNASTALDNVNMAGQRALGWIQDEQKGYWALQVRRSYERLGEARAALHLARTTKRIAGHEPSCVDEKRAVERAQRRLRLAEEKVQAVRQWSRTADRAVIEYRGCVGQLATWLDADCPRAIAALERMSGALGAYVAVKSTAQKVDLPDGIQDNAAGGEPAAEERER